MANTASKTFDHSRFKEWYQDRFNSDPANVLDHAIHDISQIAESFGINFAETSQRIHLSTTEQTLKNKRDGLVFTENKRAGSSKLWARIEFTDESNIPFPLITFNTYSQGGYTDTWSGFSYLLDLYKRDKHVPINDAEKKVQQKKLDKKLAERQKRAQAHKEKALAEEKERQENVKHDLALWDTFSPCDLNHAYLKRKKVNQKILDATDLRQGHDQRGKFIALLLKDIHLNPKGLQRIYEKKAATAGNKPTDKVYTWGLEKDGVFDCIGDVWQAIENNEDIAFCEGFATGSSYFLATNTPTIVALDSGNLIKVVNNFQAWYPNTPKVIAADNDHWKMLEGKGNAGMKSALDLLIKYPNIKAVFPNWEQAELIELSDCPTDWNDVHLQHTNRLRGINQMLKSKKNHLKAETKPFDKHLQILKYCNKYNVEKQAKVCISQGMNLAPLKMDTKDIYKIVLNTIQPSLYIEDNPDLPNILKRHAKWLSLKKLNKAKKLRGFSFDKLNQTHINHIKVTGIRNDKGHLLLPDSVEKMISTMRGVVILKAPMASGKTQKVIKPLLHKAKTAAFIAHRISLVGNSCNMLSDPQNNIYVDNYQNMTAESMPTCRFLATCINSANYLKFAPFFNNVDELFIDEAKQTLSHITAGTIDNPVPVFDFLAKVLNTANRSVLCDADANDALIEFCEIACPEQTIHVIEMEADCSDFKVNHASAELVYQSIIDCAKAGERCLVATDGAKSAADLAADIKYQIPGCRVLTITRDTNTEKEVVVFQDNPNEQSINHDVVIYSPTISSGVSIENNYFTRHFGIFYGEVSPTDAVQMLRRDRHAREFLVGFKVINKHKETDRNSIMLGKILANKISIGDDLEFAKFIHDFDHVWAHFEAVERAASNDFANNMLMMMIGDGYQVSRATANPVMEEKARVSKKNAREICHHEHVARVMSCETPDSYEAEKLNRRDYLSKDDAAKMTRYLIESELVCSVTPDVIDFVEIDHGIGRVKRLEKALAPMSKAIEYDNTLAKKGVVLVRRANVVAAKQFYDNIINELGINLVDGTGQFGSEQALNAMRSVLHDENSIAMYNELNVGPYVNPQALPKDPTKWITAIFERLGLKLKLRKEGRKKLRKHYLDLDQHGLMIGFVNNREAANISSLTITLTADEEYDLAHQQATQKNSSNLEHTEDSEGGAGYNVIDIKNKEECAPPLEGNNLLPVLSCDLEGLRWALTDIATDYNIELPDTNGNNDLLLILLVNEVKNLLLNQPEILINYPEVSWLNWDTEGVA